MDIFPTAKRAACDRCREQKLRCPPRSTPSEPCARCVKADKQCVTGYTKPLGRGQRGVVQSSVLSSEVSRSTMPASNGNAASNRRRTLSNQIPTPNSSEDSWVATGTHSLVGNMRMSSPRPQSYVPEPVDSSIWFAEMTDPNMAFIQESWNCFDDETMSDMVPEMTHSRHDADSRFHNETGGAAYSNTQSASQALAHHSLTETRSNPAETTRCTLTTEDCDCELSQLSADLCRYINNAEKLRTNKKAAADNTTASTCQHISEAIGKALESNSRFISLIQAFAKGNSGQAKSGASLLTLEDDVAASPLRLSCLLNILSTYLRLIVLFDKLFGCLHHALLADKAVSTVPASGQATSSCPTGFQLLPGLQLAGFSVVQSSFQVRILIEAVQHQFESMETDLSLPPELRVSDRDDNVSSGSPSRNTSFRLPDALQDPQHGVALLLGLEQAESFRRARADVGKDPRATVVASLRSSISEVQGLLGIQ